MQARYQTLEQIGQGGAGSVFRAWDHHLGREVALKRVAPAKDEMTQTETTQALRREATALASVNHPNVVSLLDMGHDDKGSYVVMEYLNGEDLHATASRTLLTEGDFRRMAGQLLEGLSAAHGQGVLHLDIKPANVRLTWPRGTHSFVAKLVDFGLARQQGASLMGADNRLWGSVHYMAPETFGGTDATPAADLYSLGCLFYYVLAGHVPFGGESVKDVQEAHRRHLVIPLEQRRPDLSPGLCRWVHWLIESDKSLRPHSAVSAVRTLEAIPVAAPVMTAPVTTSTEPETQAVAGREMAAQADKVMFTGRGSESAATPAVPAQDWSPVVVTPFAPAAVKQKAAALPRASRWSY